MPEIVSEKTMGDLVKKYGSKVKIGRIALSGGKYVVSVGGKKYTLDESDVVASQPLSKIVGIGGVAGVIVTDGKPSIIIVISVRPPYLRPPIICYIPVPFLRGRLDLAVRAELVKNLTAKNVLTPAIGRQIMKGMK